MSRMSAVSLSRSSLSKGSEQNNSTTTRCRFGRGYFEKSNRKPAENRPFHQPILPAVTTGDLFKPYGFVTLATLYTLYPHQ